MGIGSDGSCGVHKAGGHSSFAIGRTRFHREQFVAVFALHAVIRVMYVCIVTLKKSKKSLANLSCLLYNLLLPSLLSERETDPQSYV